MIDNTTGLMGLVTTREAARQLGISAAAVRQRIYRYGLPAVVIGKVLLVSLADLQRAVSPRNRPPVAMSD